MSDPPSPDRHERQSPHPNGDESDLYAIESVQCGAPPDLPGIVSVSPDFDALLDAVTAELLIDAGRCVSRWGTFHLAVAGGPMLQPVYERLMYDPVCRSFPWSKTHLWLVWEAAVAYDDPGSVYHQIHETLVLHSGIDLDHVHPMDALSSDGAKEYEGTLIEALGERLPEEAHLDAILLALGEDGRIDGYQGEESQRATSALVERDSSSGCLSLSATCLQGAGRVVVLAAGEACQPSVARLASGERPGPFWIQPSRGTLKWFFDSAAITGIDQ